MATGLLHCAVSAVSTVSCILLCFYLSAISAAPIRAREIPWFNNDPVPASTTQPKPTTTTPSNGFNNFNRIHGNSGSSNNGDQEPAGGFHLKLIANITVGATLSAKLKNFSTVHREFYIDVKNSGFDDINGIFRPSNGLYLLSSIVHVSARPITQEDGKAETTATALSDRQPRVTVAVCVDNICGSKAILKSYSAISSSGDLDTILVSGVLLLKQGQEVTLQVENHSNDRQIVISEQSTLSAHLLEAQE